RNREDAEKTMEAVTRWITERLKLEVSPEKTRIVNVRKRYSEFLGFKIMVYRKGGKYVVKSHICDKKLQLEESKLVEQAKRMAKPTQGRTQSEEIGLFDEMVLGNFKGLPITIRREQPAQEPDPLCGPGQHPHAGGAEPGRRLSDAHPAHGEGTHHAL